MEGGFFFAGSIARYTKAEIMRSWRVVCVVDGEKMAWSLCFQALTMQATMALSSTKLVVVWSLWRTYNWFHLKLGRPMLFRKWLLLMATVSHEKKMCSWLRVPSHLGQALPRS